MDYQVEIPRVISRHVTLPASKSITARALIIDALTCATLLPSNVAQCDDSEVLVKALQRKDGSIDVGATGTAMRFLTAYFACQEDCKIVLDGSERMRQRPIGPLVDALRYLGADIEYLGKEGFPPLKVNGKRLHGGALSMRGDVSSQFVSALLMIAPVVGGISLTLEGDLVSQSYIDMTLGLMRHYGIETQWKDHNIKVPSGQYVAYPLAIEGDWSAASYWYALQALLPQSHIVLSPLFRDSLQGDSAIVEMMAPLGVNTLFANDSVELKHEKCDLPQFYERNVVNTPDLVPTLAVTLCLLQVPFRLTGVKTLRIKESDRLEALKVELAKLGYLVETSDNNISYDGNFKEPHGDVVLDPHGDHRMAMALSLTATRHKGITIKNAQVVTKSYPDFWKYLIHNN